MEIKMKALKSLLYVFVFVVSFVFIASTLGYYVVDEILLSVALDNVTLVCILFRIEVSLCITWIVHRVINRKQSISRNEVYGFLFAYLVFILSLTLKPVMEHTMNFNIGNMVTDFNYSKYSGLLLVGNIVMYIPVGVCVQKLYGHMKSYYKVIAFVLFICIVEVVQFITLLGICDVNDILLNTFGYSTGLYGYYLLKHTTNNELERV